MNNSSAVASWKECIEYAAKTDIGLRRYNNQDAHAEDLAGSLEAFQTRGHLFLVADGMGAHAAGETASKKAAEVIPLTYRKLRDLPPQEALRQAVTEANQEIFQYAQANENFRGMGTTVSVLVLLPGTAWIAQVGDSRVYRCRGERIEQLSQDHSLVWELKRLPEEYRPQYVPKNIITRSLGPQTDVEVDIEGPLPVEPGDCFVLCTDGLSGQVSDDEIGEIVNSLPPGEAVEALVNLANLRGGPDNITVTVVRVKSAQPCRESAAKASSRQGRRSQNSLIRLLLLSISGISFLISSGIFFLVISGIFLLGIVALRVWGSQDLLKPKLPYLVGGCLLSLLVGLLLTLRLRLTPRFRSRGDLEKQPSSTVPYSATGCEFKRETLDQLLSIVDQLEETAREQHWAINWERFQALKKAASTAPDRQLREAIASACRAISLVMEFARQQKSSPHSSTNAQFYREL